MRLRRFKQAVDCPLCGKRCFRYVTSRTFDAPVTACGTCDPENWGSRTPMAERYQAALRQKILSRG